MILTKLFPKLYSQIVATNSQELKLNGKQGVFSGLLVLLSLEFIPLILIYDFFITE